MGIFANILGKIIAHPAASAPSAAAPVVPTTQAQGQPSEDVAISSPAAPTSATTAPVDVGAVLENMASMKDDHGGNYQTSIVDFLKLLDLDSSLQARKELADELNVHAGESGSAEENLALHQAVMDQLAANGGIVPDSLRQ